MSFNQEQIMEYLRSDLAIEVDDLDGETPLFSSGIIDSFALISLMTFIESEGGVRIAPSDVNLANFDSISRIQDYVNRQLEG